MQSFTLSLPAVVFSDHQMSNGNNHIVLAFLMNKKGDALLTIVDDDVGRDPLSDAMYELLLKGC